MVLVVEDVLIIEEQKVAQDLKDSGCKVLEEGTI